MNRQVDMATNPSVVLATSLGPPLQLDDIPTRTLSAILEQTDLATIDFTRETSGDVADDSKPEEE